MATPILTTARNSVWDAIEHWPALIDNNRSVFVRRYKFDDDAAPEVNPLPSQLPALALFPIEGQPTVQALQRKHQHRYNLQFQLFTSTWKLQNSDTYWIEIFKALFQSSPNNSNVTYIEAATSHPPFNDFTTTVQRSFTDNAKMLITNIDFALRVRFDPFSAS